MLQQLFTVSCKGDGSTSPEAYISGEQGACCRLACRVSCRTTGSTYTDAACMPSAASDHESNAWQVWLKQHEALFTLLRAQDNEMYIARTQAQFRRLCGLDV